MSNEENNRVEDPLVAGTYKAMAQERAPDHLNKKVLRMAAREARTPYARARAWTRPVAWAATIGLSLAIVLELTRLPQVEPDSVSIALPAEKLAEENNGAAAEPTPAAGQADRVSMDAFAPKDMAVLREAENRARIQAGPDQAAATPRADVVGAASDEGLADRDMAAEHVPAARTATRRDEAEQLSAEQVPETSSFAVTSVKKALQSELACPAQARESAESWLECIAELRESGQEDRADREYEEFQRKFPNFAEGPADR